MDANGYKWMQMDTNGCKRMQTDANGYKLNIFETGLKQLRHMEFVVGFLKKLLWLGQELFHVEKSQLGGPKSVSSSTVHSKLPSEFGLCASRKFQ